MSKNLCRAFISRVLTSSHLQMNQMRCCHDAKKVKVKVVGLLTALPMAQLFFPIIDNIDSIAFQKNSLRQGALSKHGPDLHVLVKFLVQTWIWLESAQPAILSVWSPTCDQNDPYLSDFASNIYGNYPGSCTKHMKIRN